MYKYWIVFVATVSACAATAYWDNDYDYKQYFDSDYGGSHGYPAARNSHGHNNYYPCPEWDYHSEPWTDHKPSWNNNNQDRQLPQRSPQMPLFGFGFESCLMNCRTSPEYNPVCGTDGLTYINPSALQCVRVCGKDVKVYGYFACNSGGTSSVSPNNNNVGSTSSPQQQQQACIRTCPTTSEYNPICGTNGVTYTNPSRLECAMACGVDVKVFQRSRCPPFGELPSSSSSPSLPP